MLLYAPEMNDLSAELLPYKEPLDSFAQQVEPLWPDWDYHNFREHAWEAVFEKIAIVEYERTNGIEVPTEEVVAGLLSDLEHDLGLQWGTPYLASIVEERSASVGSGIAIKLGFNKSIIEAKNESTLATEPGAECKTPRQKRARLSDVANFGWEYPRFFDKTVKVWREGQKKCLAEGKELVPFSVWVRNISGFVCNKLLNVDLALGDFDRVKPGGMSKFQARAFENFRLLDAELISPDFVEPELYPIAA